MTVVRWRLGVLFLALAVLMPFLQKSRAVSPRERAAFLRYTAGSILVKIAGAGPKDGVYRFSDGASLADVNKMTSVPLATGLGWQEGVERKLMSGDMVVYSSLYADNRSISLKKMTVVERIALGIPLDPDTLSVAEWEALSGIGPSLAQAIVLDRQKNGDYHGLDGVLRVPGFGPRKLEAVKRYFK